MLLYIGMEQKSKRGRYMDPWSPEKKKEHMSQIIKKRWEKTSLLERKKFGQFLAESRKKK